MNVWVPLKCVLRNPLGIVEWASQKPLDVQNIRLIYEHRIGELYHGLHSDAHRWVYFPEMVPGECLVFKVFDSSEDGQARFSLHASFDDAATAASAPERESVELRCIVFFDDVPEQFGSSFVAPHLAPGSPDRIDVSPKVVREVVTDEW